MSMWHVTIKIYIMRYLKDSLTYLPTRNGIMKYVTIISEALQTDITN